MKPAHVAGIILFLATISLLLRVFFLHDQVFTNAYVNFQETDPWYHVRAVEHLVHHFPRRLGFDPYALHPSGQFVAVAPLFDLILAAVAIVLGWGAPSTNLTYAVCAWFPPVLGALIAIPMYFLGKAVRDQRTGLMAAALIAVIPGEFFKRTVLGFCDHHVAECFFGLWVILFLVRTSQATCSNGEVEHRLLGAGTSAWLREAVLLGIALGAYLLSWVGGSLLVLLVFLAILLHSWINASANPDSRLCRGGAIAFVIALAMVALYYNTPGFAYHIASLSGGAAYLLAAAALIYAARGKKWPRVRLLGGLVAVGACGALLFRFAVPSTYDDVVNAVQYFFGRQGAKQVIEAGPLLVDNGVWTLAPVWRLFNVSALTTVLAIPLLLRDSTQRPSSCGLILVIWTCLTFIASLFQERFAYYLALIVALCSAYFWGRLFDWIMARCLSYSAGRQGWSSVVGVIAFVLLAVAPNLPATFQVAHGHSGPTRDWHEALAWLRENTPEPFGNDDAFLQSYTTLTSDRPYSPPSSAYGVLCWWDYGYWVTEIARRIPTANATQAGAAESARFFVAQDEVAAAEIMDRLQARYVIVDADLPVWEDASQNQLTGKFHSLIRWAGREPKEFFEKYLLPNDEGWFDLIPLYYPAYYRSMLARLYFFDAQGYIPEETTVIRYSQVSDESGLVAKRIDESFKFASFAEAEHFVGRQTKYRWVIVGTSPGHSCVPLEPLTRFRVLHKSPTVVGRGAHGDLSEVAIFAYGPNSELERSWTPRELGSK